MSIQSRTFVVITGGSQSGAKAFEESERGIKPSNQDLTMNFLDRIFRFEEDTEPGDTCDEQNAQAPYMTTNVKQI